MTSPQANIDIIATRILVDAQQALAAMKSLREQTTSTKTSVDALTAAMKAVSSQTGVGIKQSVAMVRELGSVAGFTSKQLKEAAINAGHLGTATRQAGGSMEDAFKRTFTAVNAVRIALGAMVSMLLFQVIQSIGAAFQQLVNNIRESELAIYNLINAERRLSEQGFEIDPKGLQAIIDKVKELVPILSTIQSQELVSRIATNVAPALKLTKDQIEKMAVATALLYTRNKALGKSFDEVESQLTNAFLTGKVSIGINQLGVKINDQIVLDEAMTMGLIESEEAFRNLDGEMQSHIKSVAMLNVVYKNAIQDQQALGAYMETTDASIEKTKTAWSDLMTQLGKLLSPLLGNFLRFFTMVIEGWQMLLRDMRPAVGGIVALFVGVGAVIEKLMSGKTFSGKELNQTFRDAITEFKKSFDQLANATDTPTGLAEDMSTTADNTEDAAKAMFDLLDAIEEVGIAAQDAREDLDVLLEQKKQDLEVKVTQKAADIDTEYLQKGEDAARDYGQKIEDINLDAQQAIEDAKRKAREDEFKAERDLLQKLKELRQNFLMDLEDALRERDARQVLRLIREYKNDRQNILDKKKLDDQERKDSLAADLQKIEIERRRKLQDAAIDYQQKLAQLQVQKKRELEELAIWKQRELDDLALWHQREMEEIDRHAQQKIEKLMADYAKEYSIHAEMQGKINALLKTYFGNNMAMINGLMSYMANLPAMMSAATSALTPHSLGGVLGGGIISSQSTSPNMTSLGTYAGGLAEGGTIIAKKPTVAIFGERGAEAATFTPIGRSGADVNKVFGDISGSGGMGGNIKLAVTLSPDLKAEIIDSSMREVAVVIEHVRRER